MVNFNVVHVTRDEDPVPAHHASPVVAFIIGLAIILLSSIMNAAGLNLTKLDHVRTSAIPKSARRRDWLRPLWLLGMILYILSQLIGSTLALDYMRAEYVAPLGSTSLIFNFLFARFLVGTPVTNTDIYGTVIVVLGVIGIVAFGTINSGLSAESDVNHLTYLWRRGGWLGFFFAMSIALILVLIFTYSLDAVLAARSDIEAEPFAGMSTRRPPSNATTYVGRAKAYWDSFMLWVKQYLENWTGPKDDKQIAWTLGIGWACCGGGLAGGCLVFAKATVSLLSGSLSHENPGNQFGHAAPIFTIILLAVTAVLQIICLNRGLKVYDSTLVVPVFYGVYTASGFLNSMVFNDQIDAYKPWVLFLIFVSIAILISGVVLLTHKKPEPAKAGPKEPSPAALTSKKRDVIQRSTDDDEDHGEQHALTSRDGEEGTEVWQLGDASEDEDENNAMRSRLPRTSAPNEGATSSTEGSRLLHDEYEATNRRESTSSDDMKVTQDPFKDDEGEEFGEWNSSNRQPRDLH
ncbi:hypothetical protein CONPUDRAFT_121611 [Coniophora puteana RWD-64-598 SS2]|uniref:DUF803-domain-containing protein n=1 Tax=Coniophora puteana (strain RWD-64-598) TaxID=741705 RepID=A0A5M3MVK1_CONPW|nr:uncharacterized protein CONPUDRAFT_121611 [Coniophora puteana RWD-64-598 SS2]EIW83163.1 hypothetical protein CONPUDRAFT_121611 [Coniophora puteana RWD-64-598 SS2]